MQNERPGTHGILKTWHSWYFQNERPGTHGILVNKIRKK